MSGEGAARNRGSSGVSGARGAAATLERADKPSSKRGGVACEGALAKPGG
jgi:hypothetical protein